MGCNVKCHIFKEYASIIYNKSRTYAGTGFLKETRVYIKKSHFMDTYGHFQTFVSSRKF